MTYVLLNAITASRLLICPTVWFWCWRRRPRGMVAWMVLAFAYFLVTDKLDGEWARENGLVSELGFWLDHSADVLFYGVVVTSIIRGSREPERSRDRRGRAARNAEPPDARPTPETPRETRLP